MAMQSKKNQLIKKKIFNCNSRKNYIMTILSNLSFWDVLLILSRN